MEAARHADPIRKREETLRHQQTRLQNHIERMVTAYQEELITLVELRQRIPQLRKQQQAIASELRSFELASQDQSRYLKLAETLSEFRGKLRVRAETLDTVERQKILRLVVQDVLVGSDHDSNPAFDSGDRFRQGRPQCVGLQESRLGMIRKLSFAYGESSLHPGLNSSHASGVQKCLNSCTAPRCDENPHSGTSTRKTVLSSSTRTSVLPPSASARSEIERGVN